MWRDSQRKECELEMLLSEKPIDSNVRSHLHNRRPYRDLDAQSVKWMKLIQWRLVHRVSIDMVIREAALAIRREALQQNEGRN
jgi:hypothetical protein